MPGLLEMSGLSPLRFFERLEVSSQPTPRKDWSVLLVLLLGLLRAAHSPLGLRRELRLHILQDFSKRVVLDSLWAQPEDAAAATAAEGGGAVPKVVR
jgi:hypothetical protein